MFDDADSPAGKRRHKIFFAFKNIAKKWLYTLLVGSLSSWDDFVKVFLKKFNPIYKTALIRKI